MRPCVPPPSWLVNIILLCLLSCRCYVSLPSSLVGLYCQRRSSSAAARRQQQRRQRAVAGGAHHNATAAIDEGRSHVLILKRASAHPERLARCRRACCAGEDRAGADASDGTAALLRAAQACRRNHASARRAPSPLMYPLQQLQSLYFGYQSSPPSWLTPSCGKEQGCISRNEAAVKGCWRIKQCLVEPVTCRAARRRRRMRREIPFALVGMRGAGSQALFSSQQSCRKRPWPVQLSTLLRRKSPHAHKLPL